MAFPTPKPHPLGMRRLACLLLLTACGGKPSPEKTAPVGPPRAAPALRPIDRTLHALSVNGTRLTYRINGGSGATVDPVRQAGAVDAQRMEGAIDGSQGRRGPRRADRSGLLRRRLTAARRQQEQAGQASHA